MKNPIRYLFIIGLLFSASFGLVMMGHIDNQGHGLCPFETAGVTDCNQLQNPIDFVISHLNAVSGFFSAIPINGFVFFISMVLLLAFAIFILPSGESELLKFGTAFVQKHIHESFVSPIRILLANWFALHENSPAIV